MIPPLQHARDLLSRIAGLASAAQADDTHGRSMSTFAQIASLATEARHTLAECETQQPHPSTSATLRLLREPEGLDDADPTVHMSEKAR